MSIIKTVLKIKNTNGSDVIYQQTSSDLVVRPNNTNVETSLVAIENTLGNVNDILEILLTGGNTQ